ncbi:MAG: hypothetical protein AAGK17_13505 [Pseudomonadota bacterium]
MTVATITTHTAPAKSSAEVEHEQARDAFYQKLAHYRQAQVDLLNQADQIRYTRNHDDDEVDRVAGQHSDTFKAVMMCPAVTPSQIADKIDAMSSYGEVEMHTDFDELVEALVRDSRKVLRGRCD